MEHRIVPAVNAFVPLEIGPPAVLQLAARLRIVFRERLGERLRPIGVTMAQLQVLTALVNEPGMSGAQLARVRNVSPQTIHALLMATEERGWIRRSTHPENNRTLQATLTPQGRRICVRAGKIAFELQVHVLSTFEANEVRRVEVLLEQMITNLEQWFATKRS
jgi:MarR family transcriptional regulator, organic hydroperoxide resistance regulator